MGGPLELASQDLVKHNHFSLAEEGCLASGHLVQDDTEGPEVGECARLSLVEHLGRHVQRSTHERVRSLGALHVLQLLLAAREEGRAIVFTVVKSFAVPVVNLKGKRDSLR